MDEAKKTIILTNKGKRPWDIKDVSGAVKHLEYLDTIELEEARALRLILDYPRDFTQQGVAGPSTKDIARMEQSIRDRTANLDEREKRLEEREKAVEAREKALEGVNEGAKVQPEPSSTAPDAPVKKPGRPKANP